MSNETTVYSRPVDINVIAGDTLSIPFLVENERSEPVDLVGAIVRARFCRYGYPDTTLIDKYPCRIDPDAPHGNKFWVDLLPADTDGLYDCCLEYQIYITSPATSSRDAQTRKRLSGHMNVKSSIG